MEESCEVTDPYRRPHDQEFNILRNQSAIAQTITAWDLMMVIVADEITRLRHLLPRIDLTACLHFVVRKIRNIGYRDIICQILHCVPRPIIEPIYYIPTDMNEFKFTGFTLLDVKKMIQSNTHPNEIYLRPITFPGIEASDFIEKYEYFSETTQLDTVSTLGPGSDSTPHMNRVAALELELELMKKQLAMVMAAVASNPPPGLNIPINLADTLTPKSTNPAPIASNPPPPPPPPPPLLSATVRNPTPGISKLPPPFQTSTRKSFCNADQTKSSPAPKSATPSMSDVLRELNSIKLRSIPRSPGGTPCRLNSKGESGNFLEEALIQKFRNTGLHDSSTDSICAWEDDKDENS
ncbi:hypothetical protein FO519_001139 [Halicephalobus sp. NKZ332]|nr:hypothetical protein FO519_001139 [Halicephalobus sp. NKZ332]